MEDNELIIFFKDNISEIYKNINSVYNIDKSEFTSLVKRIIHDLTTDSFYIKMLHNDKLPPKFDSESLMIIKKFLLELGFDNKKIKDIILKIPEMLLFSNNIENIYPIFKGNDFEGCAFLNGKSYKSYLYFEGDDEYHFDKDINYINSYDYDYLVNMMLNSLNRKDIKNESKLDNNPDLKAKFKALTKDYSLKNYYFKKIK